MEFNANFYDKEYFEGTSKSGYGGMYTEELEGPKKALIAQFLKSCFRDPMLDVGCAYGFLCAALQDVGVDARGIDISEYTIANALPQVKGKLSVCDVTLGTPFKDREFPTVVAFQTMEHIPIDRIPLVVKEMCRISDEYIVLEVPTWYDDKTPDRSDTFDKSHVSFYSASFWVDQFYAEGFFLDVNLSHKLKGTDSSRLVFYRGDNVPARVKNDFKVIRVASEVELKETWDDHYGIPKGYEVPQPAQVKVGAAALKILVISSTVYALPPKGYSGLEALVYEWAVEFHKAGHKVAVAAPEGSTLPAGIELIPTPLMADESQAYPRYKERLGEFDAIMDNSWLWYTVIAQMEAGDKQLPIIHIYHSDPDFLPPPPPIKFPCLIGLSKEHARKIKEKWDFEVRHNYNGIPLDFYQFKPGVQRNGRYLWCARYTPEKMPLETIRLAKKCNIPLDLYGNTSIIRDQDYLNQCMAECDASNVVFHLEVPREETVRLYQSHKALIHLVNYTEAFGLVPVEAMACGMPVIVNRRGALPELVEDGFSGFVVDTIEQAEEIIRSGKVDSIKPEDCRKSAEMFSIERSAQGYLKVFREVVAGRVW
ncbi:D-inositol-3-phosphate glycosyltransferase [subsurface metagenome]